jgi:hypothetical protein
MKRAAGRLVVTAVAAVVSLAFGRTARADNVDDLLAAIPNTARLDPQYLHGQELVVPELNFAISAPASDWVWLRLQPSPGQAPNTMHFVCVAPMNKRRFTISVPNIVAPQLTQEMADEQVKQLRERYEAQGRSVRITGPERVEQPVPGSFKYAWNGALPSGELYGGVTILSAARYPYILQASADDDEFRAFVASFRLLKHAVSFPPHFLSFMIFVIVGVGIVVSLVINLVAKRMLINGGLLGFVLGIAFLTYVCNSAPQSASNPEMTPREKGRRAGTLAGEATPALIVAIVVARWFHQRARAAEARATARRPEEGKA